MEVFKHKAAFKTSSWNKYSGININIYIRYILKLFIYICPQRIVN